MAVDDAQVPHAVAHEFLHHVLERVHEACAIQAGRAGEKISTAGFLVRFVSVCERWRDKRPNLFSYAAREFGRQENIDMHRHVMPMLLH